MGGLESVSARARVGGADFVLREPRRAVKCYIVKGYFFTTRRGLEKAGEMTRWRGTNLRVVAEAGRKAAAEATEAAKAMAAMV